MIDTDLTPQEWEALRQLSMGSGHRFLNKATLEHLVQLRLAQKRNRSIVISGDAQAALKWYMGR